MLTYIQNSNSRNAVDEATKEVDSLVSQLKGTEEVRCGYMTYEQMIEKWCADYIADAVDEAVEKAVEEAVEKAVEEARTTAIAEGHEKGLAEGREKGLAEGRENTLRETERADKAEAELAILKARLMELEKAQK